MMKKIIITILIMIVFCGVCHFEHNYTREDCEVIQKCDGIITVVDQCGFTWDYYGSDAKVGQRVDLKMYDNLTSAYIFDDEIMDIVIG